MNLQNKKVCVAGCGKSGIGAAVFLKKVGAEPILYDENEKLTAEDVRQRLPEECREIPIYTGILPKEAAGMDFLVPSPGVPLDTPFVRKFSSQGIPIMGEIEVAYQYERGRVIAITGTNGKTTTTTLVGEIMKRHVPKTFVVGNIGTPYSDYVLDSGNDTVTVAEVSSFQLETVDTFHPVVSAILNITPDHLNRHHTMEEYATVKNKITQRQTKADICVLNYENEYTREIGKKCPAEVVYFSSARRLENGLYLEKDDIFLSEDGIAEKLMNIHEMRLVGICNVENVMAAIAITLAMGVPKNLILDTICQFQAVEHRIEYTATVNGVDFYNDSKGTNPDAAIQGIRAMDRPTILIGGGYDKQSAYDEWIEAFDHKVKLLVLIGQTREKIAACAEKHDFHAVMMADSFEQAFQICVEHADPGDAVLLSPACASWGMFPNYEVRGQLFKDMVHKLGQSVELKGE